MQVGQRARGHPHGLRTQAGAGGWRDLVRVRVRVRVGVRVRVRGYGLG